MNVSTTGGLLACLAFAVMTPFAHSAPTTVSPVDMVFTSDPQYPWTEKTDAGETQTDSERDSRSKWLIETQYDDIASFRKNFGGAARVPVMICLWSWLAALGGQADSGQQVARPV
jgi:hypothetical protein